MQSKAEITNSPSQLCTVVFRTLCVSGLPAQPPYFLLGVQGIFIDCILSCSPLLPMSPTANPHQRQSPVLQPCALDVLVPTEEPPVSGLLGPRTSRWYDPGPLLHLPFSFLVFIFLVMTHLHACPTIRGRCHLYSLSPRLSASPPTAAAVGWK